MNNFLREANFTSISSDSAKNARKAIMERWEGVGFLEGTSGYLKENLATIYENETKLLTEATDAQNSGSFETVVFPLVRRVFSRLLANDIVSVQAMNMPIGKLFFILPVTSERKWEDVDMGNLDGATGSHYGLMGYERTDRRNGDKINRYYLPDDVINDIDVTGQTPEVVKYMKKSLYDLFYNDFLYDHSKGKVHLKVGEIEAVKLGATGAFYNDEQVKELQKKGIQIEDVIPTHTDGSVRNVVVSVKGFSSYTPGKLIGPDGNEMDTEAFLASLKVITKQAINATGETDFASFKQYEEVHFRLVTQQYGRGIVDYKNGPDADGKLYIELDLAKPVTKPGANIWGYKGIDPTIVTAANISNYFQVAWAQYDSLELETEIGEVSFELTSVTVSVEERKLRATWSPEMAQDVAAFHNLDAEAELTAILSEQVAAEIDREILRDLRKASPWQLKWDYNGWRRQAGFSTNYTQKDWNQTLMTLINQISAQIQKASLRSGANFCVVSAEIGAVLNDLEYFHVTDAQAENVNYSMGIEKIGALQGRYQVYVDPYSPHWSAIIGHKGDSLLDTGYIYAPYVPMQLTPVIYNPSNFAPVRGILTRYAKKIVNNRFYGAIVVNGLQTWDINELR